MKAFIDGGAYKGDTVKMFMVGKVLSHPDAKDFKVFAFDINNYGIKWIERKAMGTFDGITKVAINKKRPMASTIEPNNMLYYTGEFPFRYDKPYTKHNEVEYDNVIVFDFPKWFKETFSPKDYIILKMDIEGSEFDILERMLADNTLRWVDVLAVEFHSFHLPYKDREEKLRKAIDKLGVKFIDWQLYND